jgi:hypothetical protein
MPSGNVLYFLKKIPGDFALTCQLRTFLYPVVRNFSIAARRKAHRCQSDGTELEVLPGPDSSGAETNPGARDELVCRCWRA